MLSAQFTLKHERHALSEGRRRSWHLAQVASSPHFFSLALNSADTVAWAPSLPPQTHNTHPEEKLKKMDGTENATDESVPAESPF